MIDPEDLMGLVFIVEKEAIVRANAENGRKNLRK